MNAGSNWADLELLDHILRHRTLSGAAAALGVDQTTVSRRLAALERRIGSALFDRIDGKLVATPPLSGIIDRLRTISQEASLSIASLMRATAELKDHVRVTSVGFVLSTLLAPALDVFARQNPGISLDFVADDQSLSFERREADIALRFGRTAEQDTKIRSLGTLRFHLCRPAGVNEETAGKVVVRYGERLAHVPEMQALDRLRPQARTVLTSTRLDVLIAASLALGADLMLPESIARKDARFDLVEEPNAIAERPLFLLTHPERVKVPAVALTAEWIAETVKAWQN